MESYADKQRKELSTTAGECRCGGIEDIRAVHVKLDGTVDTYLRGGPFHLCKSCRTARRGRWRHHGGL